MSLACSRRIIIMLAMSVIVNSGLNDLKGGPRMHCKCVGPSVLRDIVGKAP